LPHGCLPSCPVPAAVSSATNPASPTLPHAAYKTPAAATRSVRRRSLTAPPPHGSVYAGVFHLLVLLSFLHFITLPARKTGGFV
jgi:hypothetical protein